MRLAILEELNLKTWCRVPMRVVEHTMSNAATAPISAELEISAEPTPSVAFKVLRVLDRPNSTCAQVGEVLAEDPSLSRQILKMARSPLCGVRSPDLTAARAIVLLGFVTVRKLVVVSLCRELSSLSEGDGDGWRNALWVGIAAEEITRRIDETIASDALMAGMTASMSSQFAQLGSTAPATPDSGVDPKRMARFLAGAQAVASLIIAAQPGLPATADVDEALEGAGLMPLYDGRLAVDIRRGFELYSSLTA